jgi:hypothetical protein
MLLGSCEQESAISAGAANALHGGAPVLVVRSTRSKGLTAARYEPGR